MSTILATATPPPSPANFKDEPQIYISRATLQLKQNFDEFAWQTVVITSPPLSPKQQEVLAPEAEVQAKEVVEQCQTASKQEQQTKPHKKLAPPPPPPRNNNNSNTSNNQRWTPAKKHGVPETIFTIVDNFMDSERYHTICNSNQQNALLKHAAGAGHAVTTSRI